MNTLPLIDSTTPEAAEEIAHAAYKELLAAPLPATLADFRRAIIQGVLIGRVLESAQPGDGQAKDSFLPNEDCHFK